MEVGGRRGDWGYEEEGVIGGVIRDRRGDKEIGEVIGDRKGWCEAGGGNI